MNKPEKLNNMDEVFKFIHPACISLVKNPSVDAVKNLRSKLEAVVQLQLLNDMKNDKEKKLQQKERILTPLLEFITLPLKIILMKPDLPWILAEESAQCLGLALQHGWCDSFKFYQHTFSVLVAVLVDGNDPSTVSGVCEELKGRVLDCLVSLQNSCTERLLLELLQVDAFLPQLGHAVFVCLKIAQQETSRTLRIQALDTVCKLGLQGRILESSSLEITPMGPFIVPNLKSSALQKRVLKYSCSTQIRSNTCCSSGTAAFSFTSSESCSAPCTSCPALCASCHSSDTSRHSSCVCCPSWQRPLGLRLREVLSGFLPGVCTTAAKLALLEETQGHALPVAAIQTLAYFTAMLLEDDFVDNCVLTPPTTPSTTTSTSSTLLDFQRQLMKGLEQQGMRTMEEEEEEKKKKEKENEEKEKGEEVGPLTSRWLSATSGRLSQLFKALCSQLVAHSHPAVRRQLVLWAGQLVTYSSRTLPGCSGAAVEVLATLAADSDASVRRAATTHLLHAPDACDGGGGGDVGVGAGAGGDDQDGAEGGDGKGETLNSNNKLKLCNGQEGTSQYKSETCNSKEEELNYRTNAPRPVITSSTITARGLQSGPVRLHTSLQAAVQERLCLAIKRLPTVARAADSRRLLTSLRQVTGCFRLLGPTASCNFLQLPGQLPGLLHALASTATYHLHGAHLLQESPITADHILAPLRSPIQEPQRSYLCSPSLVAEGWRVCGLLGGCAPPPLLLHEWAQAGRGAGGGKPEMMWIMAGMLQGFLNSDLNVDGSDFKQHLTDEEKENLVSNILDLVVTDSALLLPLRLEDFKTNSNNITKNSTDATQSVDSKVDSNLDIKKSSLKSNNDGILDSLDTIYKTYNTSFNTYAGQSSTIIDIYDNSHSSSPVVVEFKHNILTVVNSLRVIASCARLMQDKFTMFLSVVMCPVMEKCGENNILVATAGRHTLEEVGKWCGCGGLQGLVEVAVPHFWYPLSMQLKNPKMYPKAPQILQVALGSGGTRGNAALAVFTQQLLHELLSCLDLHHTAAPHQLLLVLRLYVAGKAGNKTKSVDLGDGRVVGKNTDGDESGTTGCEHREGDIIKNVAADEDGGRKSFSQGGLEEAGDEERGDDQGNGRKNGSHCTKRLIKRTTKAMNSIHVKLKDDFDSDDEQDDSKKTLPANSAQKQVPSNPSIEELNCDTLHYENANINRHATSIYLNNENKPGLVTKSLLEYHRNKLKMKEGFIRDEERVKEEMEEELGKINAEETYGMKGFKKYISEQGMKEESYDGENDKRDDEEKVPDDIKLVVDIMDRCCFLLHSKERAVLLLLLDTIELGCSALQQRENSQLPVLHKIWKPLILRIKDKDVVVSLRALTVCCLMTNTSGDFLRKRCMQELLPALNGFLISQSTTSLGEKARTGYLMSTAFLTQKKLLQFHYPELLKGLKLGAAEIINVVNTCACYLDRRQPEELVTASMQMLRLVATTHPEQVWFAMASLLPPRQHTPPCSQLKTIRIDGGTHDRRFLPGSVAILYAELCSLDDK